MRRRLFEKVGVCSCAFQDEELGVKSVDQKPIWLDVAFPMVVPVAGKVVVPVPERQGFLGLEQVNDSFELVDVVAAFFGELEVFEETGGRFDDEQDLGACVVSESAEGLEGG